MTAESPGQLRRGRGVSRAVSFYEGFEELGERAADLLIFAFTQREEQVAEAAAP